MLPTSTYHLLWEPETTIKVDKESCTLQGTNISLGKRKIIGSKLPPGKRLRLVPWRIPSWKLTYPTWGKGKSSSNMPYQGDMLIPWRISLQKIFC